MGYSSVMKWGNNILYRGYDTDGTRFVDKIKYSPILYSHSDVDSFGRDMFDNRVRAFRFDTMKRAKEFIQGQPEKSVFGMNRFEYAYLTTNEIEQHPSLKTVHIDIETECENGFPEPEHAAEELLVITMKTSGGDMYTLGRTKHVKSPDDTRNIQVNSSHVVEHFDSEANLIEAFLKYWGKIDADIVSGWNCSLFDMPYLYNRIRNVLGEKTANRLSPWGNVTARNVMINGKPQSSFVFYGINILDYYDLYRKFTYTQLSSYKLDHVAYVELGEKKLSYKEHDSMHSFYKSDWKKFVDYNVKDVELIDQLEKNLGFIELALETTSYARANPHDIFSQVRIWDLIIYNYLYKRSIHIPARVDPPSDTTNQYAGAYVKEPVPGVYDWIITLDVASMYPNAIRFLNMSPETIISDSDAPECFSDLKKKADETTIEGIVSDTSESGFEKFLKKHASENNVSVSPTGDVYTRDKAGFLPDIMKKMFADRKSYKKLAESSKSDAEMIEKELLSRGVNIKDL